MKNQKPAPVVEVFSDPSDRGNIQDSCVRHFTKNPQRQFTVAAVECYGYIAAGVSIPNLEKGDVFSKPRGRDQALGIALSKNPVYKDFTFGQYWRMKDEDATDKEVLHQFVMALGEELLEDSSFFERTKLMLAGIREIRKQKKALDDAYEICARMSL